MRKSYHSIILLILIAALLCFGCSSNSSYSSEDIKEIAVSNDYDAMIDALNACIDECESVKDEYLNGDLPDKDAENQMKEILNRYNPVVEKLEKADSNGELTYNQHKELADLLSRIFDSTLDGAKKVLDDAGIDIEDLENSSY